MSRAKYWRRSQDGTPVLVMRVKHDLDRRRLRNYMALYCLRNLDAGGRIPLLPSRRKAEKFIRSHLRAHGQLQGEPALLAEATEFERERAELFAEAAMRKFWPALRYDMPELYREDK